MSQPFLARNTAAPRQTLLKPDTLYCFRSRSLKNQFVRSQKLPTSLCTKIRAAGSCCSSAVAVSLSAASEIRDRQQRRSVDCRVVYFDKPRENEPIILQYADLEVGQSTALGFYHQ